MKRVLIFSLNYFPRFIGGAEVAIKEITDRLPSSQVEFHLLTLRFDSELPREERIGKVIVHRIGWTVRHPSIADLNRWPLRILKFWYQIASVWHASRLHSQYHFDAIWAMMAHAVGNAAALFKLFHPRIPYLLTLQEGDPPHQIERQMRIVWPLFKRAFTTADAIQTISTFLSRWARHMGSAEESIVLIPNAVDTTAFSERPSDDALAQARARLGKKQGDVFLITTSRLVQKNAVDDVIRALPLLHPSISFIIGGIGPDESHLRSLAQALQVESRVHFLGQIPQSDIPLLLTACDIFIRPSRSEGFGNSFIEAMAARVPVIATQEGGISDFLFDAKRDPEKGTTGWAVDKNSPSQIADAVRDILDEPQKRERIVETAARLVTEKYDWNIIARDMNVLFKQLLDK